VLGGWLWLASATAVVFGLNAERWVLSLNATLLEIVWDGSLRLLFTDRRFSTPRVDTPDDRAAQCWSKLR
jgi:hypothetical protein